MSNSLTNIHSSTSPINTSPTKQMFSFSKANRFPRKHQYRYKFVSCLCIVGLNQSFTTLTNCQDLYEWSSWMRSWINVLRFYVLSYGNFFWDGKNEAFIYGVVGLGNPPLIKIKAYMFTWDEIFDCSMDGEKEEGGQWHGWCIGFYIRGKT